MGLFSDGFKELKKASEPLYKSPKSIQETIEIMAVAENGIFEVSRNRYSKCYRFQDINYTTALDQNDKKGCVRKLYIDIARSREKYIPTMSDSYDLLLEQPEEEAKDIALSLELFVSGSLNIFNHQTNVDVDNRFTVYGIRDLGAELSPITMLVMMESIQQRIVENGKKGKATWLYIDEFHVLLNSEYSAKYLQQLWKKVR